jgi:demethylmenaquinone methyltransferase/2-methoxy-6-polyprenyl-1,4-benzoquinol methylase
VTEDVYRDEYVRALFDRMGPTYDLVNWVSSFGFSSMWRRLCVRLGQVKPGDAVCDMMAGAGECWPHLPPGWSSLVAIDFSPEMVARQKRRRARLAGPFSTLCENATATSLPDASVDCVISAFGLKTLSKEALGRFAMEIERILKPGGRFALIEISRADSWALGPLYRWYLGSVIPWVGKLCLGDIECYRMLGEYTAAFGSCAHVAPVLVDAGLNVEVKEHFFGCATSLVGVKR